MVEIKRHRHFGTLEIWCSRGQEVGESVEKTPVVGKSACGQVDRPLELDLNPRQKNAYHGH